MVPDLSKISGVSDYAITKEKSRTLYSVAGRVFLVVSKNTIEVRCDAKLGDLLQAKYESVMESRYFGKGGIEIIPVGQLSTDEIADLIRLSFDITKQKDPA